MNENLILLGGGGHCKSVIDVIESLGTYSIAGIVDKPELLGESVNGYKVIASDDDLPVLAKEYKNFLVTVGQIKKSDVRAKLFNKIKELGGCLPIIISPHAIVSISCFIDEGTVVHHRAVINANSIIGRNCIINTAALIEHDVLIKDHVHISTGVVVNGNSIIKDNCFIGSNSTIINNIIIENNCIVGAGAVVLTNTEPFTLSAGNPAKIKKQYHV